MKRCSKCGLEQDLSQYSERSGGRSGLHSWCRTCYRDDARARRKRKPGGTREAVLRQYGMGVEDYKRILSEQGGRCAVCGTDKPGGHGSFHVDHDHETSAVRGLLCGKCNMGLGLLGDNPKQAAERLWKYAEATELYLDYAI